VKENWKELLKKRQKGGGKVENRQGETMGQWRKASMRSLSSCRTPLRDSKGLRQKVKGYNKRGKLKGTVQTQKERVVQGGIRGGGSGNGSSNKEKLKK